MNMNLGYYENIWIFVKQNYIWYHISFLNVSIISIPPVMTFEYDEIQAGHVFYGNTNVRSITFSWDVQNVDNLGN